MDKKRKSSRERLAERLEKYQEGLEFPFSPEHIAGIQRATEEGFRSPLADVARQAQAQVKHIAQDTQRFAAEEAELRELQLKAARLAAAGTVEDKPKEAEPRGRKPNKYKKECFDARAEYVEHCRKKGMKKPPPWDHKMLKWMRGVTQWKKLLDNLKLELDEKLRDNDDALIKIVKLRKERHGR